MRSITEIVSRFKLNWTQELSDENIALACRQNEMNWNESLLTPVVTMQLFFLQVLHGNTACQHLPRLGKNWGKKLGEKTGDTPHRLETSKNWGHTTLVIGLANWESMADFRKAHLFGMNSPSFSHSYTAGSQKERPLYTAK